MFVDTHCHLCPGLDNGPRNMDEALQMCHIAWNEGVRAIAATAHQNEHWSDVTPKRICTSTDAVAEQLAAIGSPMRLVPTAEVMIRSLFIWMPVNIPLKSNSGKMEPKSIKF